MPLVIRPILLGLASGGRSTAGLAALAARAHPAGTGPGWGRRAALLAAAGELLVDKLPQTPSRLARPALAGRVLAGAASGAILARGPARSVPATVLAAALAGSAAWAGAQAGARWRSVSARRFGADWPGAVIEDAAVLALAASGSRG